MLLLVQEVVLLLQTLLELRLRHRVERDLCETSETRLQDRRDIILTARRAVHKFSSLKLHLLCKSTLLYQ